MKSVLKHIEILGTPVACATYDTAVETIRTLAQKEAASAVCACNTHIVSMARHDRKFGRVMRSFDLILPDGMPLIWEMNRRSAGLKDRVYGPYLMRRALQLLGPPWKHFFFGGTEECLRDLEVQARLLCPNLKLAGSYSPPFRPWTELDEDEFARIIAENDPDFIWVALGGERQERWISRNLHRYRRGVFLAVGDAFELLARRRSFAPAWLQRIGLTWLYRLIQEPKRLWLRYLKFNTLFLYYLLRDGVLKKRGLPDLAPADVGAAPVRIAFIGCRGVPARYSGFETLVEQLGARLAKRGYDVTVYNRDPYYDGRRNEWRGMKIVWLPTVPTKSLDTIVHTFFSIVHALFCGYDWIYICGVGNAPLVKISKLFGCSRLIINVDGADFRRAKWNGFARWWLKWSERKAVKLADVLIADNHEIVKRYQTDYQFKPRYVSYGAITAQPEVRAGELERWGLKSREYILYVSRLTPENEPDLLLEAYALAGGLPPLVIAGSAGYERSYYKRLKRMAGERVVFTGSRYGDVYAELSQHSLFFVMPAAIEATRLVLLDQMGFGAAILYRDVPATREVVGETGVPFGFGASDRAMLLEALAGKMRELAAHPVDCLEIGAAARARASELFDWERVADEYEEIFRHQKPGPVG
ncbi:MAG: WecB/TagA/CpsF family glycosyltransferase [Methylacidiphilales bacterium]|nr:WecB/TagA/CpsF family glycosyltransferase [Candidatus Methylacidiphilales bacterium]